MPESETHSGSKARAKSQQGSRHRESSTDRAQITSEPTAGMQELQHPWEILLGGDFSQSIFERHAGLMGDGRLSHPANARQRALIVQQLQRDYGNQYVQRLVEHVMRLRSAATSDSVLDSPMVQAAEEENHTGDAYQVTPDVAARIDTERTSGQPLDSETRREMESSFGRDLTDVRVHTGPEAHELNREVEAEAFTTGRDIFFGDGNYDPGSPEGKQLLAHELTHVVQQSGVSRATQTPMPKSVSAEAERVTVNRVTAPTKEKETELEAPAAETPESLTEEASSEVVPETAVSDTESAEGTSAESGPEAQSSAEAAGQASATPEAVEEGAQEAAGDTPEAATAEAASATGAAAGAAPEAGTATPEVASEAEEPAPAEESPGVATQEPEVAASPEGGPGESGGAEGGAGAAGEGSPASPEEDPTFQAVAARVGAAAAQEQVHAPTGAASAAAQAAAVGPTNEVASLAAAGQVEEMNQQQPQPFDRAAFKAALMQKIAEMAPKTLEEADQFKSSNQLASVKSGLTEKVDQGKEQAQGTIEEKTEETPDTSGVTPKPVTPLQPQEAGPPPPDVGPVQATPKAKTEAVVSAPFQEGSQGLDQQMAGSQITEEQLEKSNEPTFQSALRAKQEAQADAAQSPVAYRQHEQEVLSQAQADAAATTQTQMEAMHGDRAQLLAQVTGNQEQAKSQDEQKRAEVANHIQEIYGKSKAAVEARLTQLDTDVQQAFANGADDAKKAFEDYVDGRMKAYKEERYSGILGWARWLKDKIAGMPSVVNQFYSLGRELYIIKMGAVIDNVVGIVEAGLAGAKAIVAQGRQEIQVYVAGLEPSLQSVGQEAAGEIQGKFEELEQSVSDKQSELVDSLAQKYNENLQQMDSRIEELKSSNRGLVDKAFDAVAGAIRTILQLKNMLMSVLGKASSVVMTIVNDPIGFVSNLVTGVKQGLGNFMSKIGDYLKQGLIGWLTGAIASAGIQMPDKLDLKGIFSLVMQVLGLTYDAVRSLAVKALGEKVVGVLEKTFDIFKIMVTEGVAGLWNFVQDKIGDLKALVMDKIQDMLITKVIKAGIKWIIGLLSPAGALIKACMAIYDIIKFFITRGKEILGLVNAVIDSVVAIAKGNLGGAAKLVEDALAKGVPVAIGFLASLLGLGGIGEKVQGIFKTVQKPIKKAIGWVLGQARKFARKMGKALGFGKGKKAGEGELTEAEAALPHAEVEGSFSLGESHTVTASTEEGRFDITIASRRASLMEALRGAMRHVEDNPDEYDDGVLARLQHAYHISNYEIIHQDWIIKGGGDPQNTGDKQKYDIDKFLKLRVSMIINDLESLRNKGIKSLEDFFQGLHGHPSTYVYADEINVDLQKESRWRSAFYGSFNADAEDFRRKQLDDLKDEAKDKKWQTDMLYNDKHKRAFVCKLGNHLAEHKKRNVHLDHIDPQVVEHWNKEGRSTDQDTRQKWYNETDNLRVICGPCNSGREKGTAIFEVGENFRGPGEGKA